MASASPSASSSATLAAVALGERLGAVAGLAEELLDGLPAPLDERLEVPGSGLEGFVLEGAHPPTLVPSQ